MEMVVKCAGVAVIGALLALCSRKQEFSILVSIGAVLLVAGMAMTMLRPVLSFVDTLKTAAGLGEGTVAPVLKALTIGFLTGIGANLCEDAGEAAIGAVLKMAGGIGAVYVLLPLMESLLELLEQML